MLLLGGLLLAGAVTVNHWLPPNPMADEVALQQRGGGRLRSAPELRGQLRQDSMRPSLRAWVESLAGMWSLFMSQAVPAPLVARWSRPLWASVALTALIITTIQQSLHASYAMHPRRRWMRTLEELVVARIPIGVAVEGFSELQAEPGVWVDCIELDCEPRFTQSWGDFALMVDRSDIFGLLLHLDMPYFVMPYVMLFPKGHALAGDFSAQLERLHSAGLVRFILKDWTPFPRKKVVPKPLSLREVGPIFRVMLYVLPLALLSFLWEVRSAQSGSAR
jgi:hypothetical protein